MTDRYDDSEIPDLTEIGGHWDAHEPTHHNGDFVFPGRRVAVLPGRTWPSIPEHCAAERGDTEWILDGKVLLCLGCGMDAT